ncbi:TetR family transcriptional regulator [Nonomuraea turkmeniaca]|uniref:TetR family transcriptional regulator n=1 Tax=Nonomuraea turkmeniaca TaxID=103838 RepID=A0A5S4F3J1_9ACTN|nr:TetR/AcrR family transcriptional regulator C-terminal domain-containing protein [Nonomuraea turkmeniaca]TMR10710.1 TetR family transcriptional regulator [Nonomuraea turkmeniaca]
MAQERALPSVVERMWGREPVTRRGPRPRLNLAAITAAAIEIADAEGLAGVSMAAVAARVGVAATALYRYVESKEDLLTAMADAAAPLPPEPEGRTWREYLAVWTRTHRDILLDRPWLLSVAGSVPPMGPRRLLWLDRALASLDGTGLDDGEKINVASALTGYALTDAALVHAVAGGDPRMEEAGIKGAADYGEVLAGVLDPETYPALSAAMRSGAMRGAEGWMDDGDFVFGLDLLLDGIEALIRRRALEGHGGGE